MGGCRSGQWAGERPANLGQTLRKSKDSGSENQRCQKNDHPTGRHCGLSEKHKKKQLEEKLAAGPVYNDNGLVVCTQLGNLVDPAVINRDMDAVLKNSDLPKIRFHDLRHTHATILLQLGENPKVVAERLGHVNVRMTLDIYSEKNAGIPLFIGIPAYMLMIMHFSSGQRSMGSTEPLPGILVVPSLPCRRERPAVRAR
ncbi:tyrosine-type recombinase/integrase [Planifilum fulgidum]|uniref:tyrosine-type recombinase/integrase n=1 Tax=Planifilum fulgidum TaxID=201973 RepID=UPI003CCBC031